MNDINHPVPSLKSLIIATVFAGLLAIAILLSAVLPAEYGFDPTGLGEIMGVNGFIGTNQSFEPAARHHLSGSASTSW
jgi:hypothetical protein